MPKCSYYFKSGGMLMMASDKEAVGESSQEKTPQHVLSTKVELKSFIGNENFMLWQRRMNHVLKQQGLSFVSAGKEKKPNTTMEAEWEARDELARGAIEQHLTDGVLCNAIEDTTKYTWEKLEELFASRLLSNKLFLKEELHSLKMEEGANMMERVSALNRCIVDLQGMDEVYKSEDKAMMLLTSLPLSYKHFRTTLMLGLMARTERRGCSNKRGDKSSKGRNSRFEDDEGCFKYGSKDHWKWNCPVWKVKRNKMKDAKSSGAINVSTGCETDDELLTVMDEEHNGEVVAHSLGKSSTSVWILDSNCSFHVCSNRMGFNTYEERNGSKILLGDKTSCDVLDMGTVKINTQDGVVRSLSEVRHVPKLRRNLISLGALDREGYSYKAKEGMLLVTRGSVVISRGKIQPNNVYQHLGGIIASRTENSTNEVICTKEKLARDLVKESVQWNEATTMLKTS
ncbi:PREDICTED: Retrovirus-related Pol poly from transposon [Prunus dulcis]|uniref:PREDICTED: Retrovirus-related Pol poly from transposon n=1 Tax=Prunus dulcis TaxID=3755 RepID=A0A5E4GNI7_PRUDU|nr:hypothetical protein L3X38_018212 [Prunus dulcis]VVA41457.1 PREDICTED: Retrovirus-related Pol poly from transposon [Prunus dulcis]